MENGGKVRVLRIWELLQETDAEHPISTAQIERALGERWGVEGYRITIRNDVESLLAAGYAIATIHSTQNKYYISERHFELPELKLLIDAVESSRFITARKSRKLTDKLSALASPYEAEALKRNISLSDRVKAGNEQIYYIMDALNEAINLRRKVRFYYFEYDESKRRQLKNDGEPYDFSPYSLTWNGDFYYVIGWSDKHGKIATFRVDRIFRVPELLDERAAAKPKGFAVGDFAEKAFQLFDGERAEVELLCERGTMGTVIDHFGEKVKAVPEKDGRFRVKAEVSLSPPFYAWVFEFGGMIRIVSPQKAVDEYAALAKTAAKAARLSTKENQ